MPGPQPFGLKFDAGCPIYRDMGIMSEIDIMRQEGDRTPEDFEARGYDRETAEAMAEIVQGAERTDSTRMASFDTREVWTDEF